MTMCVTLCIIVFLKLYLKFCIKISFYMYIYSYSAKRLNRLVGHLNRLNSKQRVADRLTLAFRITLFWPG